MSRSDDELAIEVIRAWMRSTDPVPPEVEAMARAIPDLERLDAALAELVEATTAVRDDDLGFHFSSGQVEIFASFGSQSLEVDVIGTEPERVLAERSNGELQSLSHQLGVWQLTALDAGSIRIVVEHDGRRTASAWFTLDAPPT